MFKTRGLMWYVVRLSLVCIALATFCRLSQMSNMGLWPDVARGLVVFGVVFVLPALLVLWLKWAENKEKGL
jgi:hypothetical protein